MRKLLGLVALFALSFSPMVAFAAVVQPGPTTNTSGVCTNGNPCEPAVGDQPFVAVPTTSLAQIIAAPTNAVQAIHFTSISAMGYESATGGVLEIEQGTGTNCASNASVIAYVLYLPASAGVATFSVGSGNGSVLIVKPGYAACVIVAAGTITAAGIWGTYAIL